jgi:hypothetical protein
MTAEERRRYKAYHESGEVWQLNEGELAIGSYLVQAAPSLSGYDRRLGIHEGVLRGTAISEAKGFMTDSTQVMVGVLLWLVTSPRIAREQMFVPEMHHLARLLDADRLAVHAALGLRGRVKVSWRPTG